MKIIVASDHAGYPLKQAVVELLAAQGLPVDDGGPASAADSVDYPEVAQRVGRKVAAGEYQRGVLICGTGLGVSIAANKTPGVRAALCHDVFTARQSRAHNDANVLAMGAWVVTPQRAAGILDAWLHTEFEGGRHLPRLAMLDRAFAAAAAPDLQAHAGPIRPLRLGLALSPHPTTFGPLLFSGRMAEGIRAAAEAGFGAVELSLRAADTFEAKPLLKMLGEHGLELAAIATGQACLSDGLCLAAADAAARRGAEDRLKAAIALGADFGAAVIVGGIRGRLTGSAPEQMQQRAAAVAAIRRCTRYAFEFGVPLLIEPINRYETNFINNTSEGLALLDELGEPGVRLLLDSFHMNIEEADVAASLNQVGDRLGYVHLADSNRRAPGQGHLDFGALLRCLNQMGYQGTVTAEILPLPDDATAVRQAGTFLRALLGAAPERRLEPKS